MFKKDKKYLSIGLTALVVILASILFTAILFRLSDFVTAANRVLKVFSPLFYGAGFALLMNPVLKVVENTLYRWFSKGSMPDRSAKKLSRALGLVVALVVFLVVIYAIIALIIPDLVNSLSETFSQENLNKYYHTITEWTNNVIRGTAIQNWVNINGTSILNYIGDWITEKVDVASAVTGALSQVVNVVSGIANAVIGVVFAIYLLSSKEKLLSQTKKLTVAVFKPSFADRLLELARRTNRIFSGFIVGKIIDSLIIGILCYVGMRIMRLPYADVISVFVGLTNIIPFFGPVIGIGAGAILLVLNSPLQALYFLVFGIILQQLDGNVIGPKILGDRLGIDDIWILVSITVFGGLFGFVGMLLGVPVFTLLYSIVKDLTERSLKKKEQPIASDCYYSILTVSDLDRYKRTYGDATVVNSEDTFDTEYDPDDEIEYDGIDTD